MVLHQGTFCRIERAPFQQYRIRNPDLADVVQESSPMQRDLLIVAKPQALTECGRVSREALTVPLRVRVACFDRQRG